MAVGSPLKDRAVTQSTRTAPPIQARSSGPATLDPKPAARNAGAANPELSPAFQLRRIARDLAMVGGGTAVGHALGIVTSLVQRALLEPSFMGIWSGLKLFLSYSNYAGLGASKGAAREIPIELARGNPAGAQRAADVAYGVNTVTSVLYALVLLGVAVWTAQHASGPLAGYWSAGLVVTAAIVVLQRYATFTVTVLRAQQRFDLTTKVAILEAVVALAATAVGIWCFGIYGLFGAAIVVLIANMAFLRWQGAPRFRCRWDWPQTRRLLAGGAPILVGGTLLTLLRSLDRLMILSYLPERELALGCYSLALMVSGQLCGLGSLVGIVMYPRYQVLFGQSGDPRQVARMAVRVMLATAVVLGSLALVAALAAPPLLGWLLPAYRVGLPAMVAMLPGSVCLAMSIPAAHYLIAVGQPHRTAVVAALAIGLAAAANHVVLTRGGGITAVAWATSAAYAAYFVLLTAVSLAPAFLRTRAWTMRDR